LFANIKKAISAPLLPALVILITACSLLSNEPRIEYQTESLDHVEAQISVRATTSFTVPMWCGERKEAFTMDGVEFTLLEQYETELEVVLPQKRILGIFAVPGPEATLVEMFTVTEPSNFLSPGEMSLPAFVQLRPGKTIRINCEKILRLPTSEDEMGSVDQQLSDLLMNEAYFHGVLTIESDSRDLKVFQNKIVRSSRCVEQGSGFDCLDSQLDSTRKEFSGVSASVSREVDLRVAPLGCIEATDTCKLYNVNAADFSPNADKLFQIDPANGSQLDAVTMTLPSETIKRGNALAADPIANVLYGVLDINNCSRPLATIDPDTGVATMVGDSGSRLSALAFDTSGTLYAVSGRSLSGGTGLANCTHPARTLFKVDKTNGQLTELCALPSTAPLDRAEALTFKPTDNLLYFATGDIPTLHTIDSTSGPNCSLTNIPLTGGALSAAGSRVRGMVFNPFTGNILASNGTSLFSITPGGVDTLLGTLVGGGENLRQMAFVRQ
jgi:hypothetical protein